MSDRETQPGSIIPGVDWESGVKRLMGNEQLYRKLLAKFAASYGDTLYLNFTRTIAETTVEREFFTSLVKLGIPVKVESNNQPF